MALVQRDIVVGVFRDPEQARQAIEGLKDAGFSANDISLLMRDQDRARVIAEDTGTEAGAGAATGAVAGGLLGGLGGWLVGISSIVVPGVGPIIGAGAVATAAVAGAAIGAGVGAIAGALAGQGVPEEEAQYYEEEVRAGRTLVTVRTGVDRYEQAEAILRNYGAYDIRERETAVGEPQTTGTVYDREPLAAASADRSGTTYASDWHEEMPRYRAEWEQGYGTAGGRWEEVEPRYRYGWEAARSGAHRDWEAAEPELRRGWEERHRDQPWEEAREHVRASWDRITVRPRS